MAEGRKEEKTIRLVRSFYQIRGIVEFYQRLEIYSNSLENGVNVPESVSNGLEE